MTTEVISTPERTFVKIDPEIENALRDAHNYKMAGDYNLALNMFNEIIEKDPANARALHHKANVLDLMGKYTDALSCYNSALECDPYNAEIWYNKGMTLRKTGSHEEGLEHIRKGISMAMGQI
ncbi:MAG: tetratricopeptide repeat protein [Methanospirillum sp.]|uniref:tetratricopeptide repeat protein n=1 Tax=Methanospirillum sp. TaxID=45200 RepID=UPI00236C4B97|nr:tetratricopeptide repeat protein [Methanospirillum sp.]MDD1727909.1 tetratricopeptide repeat protein [Methanospirillum sp.]